MKKTVVVFMLLVLLVTVLIAAAQDDELPDPADLEAGWNYVELGGENVCALGDPFGFFVYPGESENLTIHLQVGGGCWDATTCQPESGLYTTAVNPEAFNEPVGIFNMEDTENPLGDYTHVVIPSCNGDVHLGNETVTYEPVEMEDGSMTDELTFNRLGFFNATTVLDWVYEAYPEPENVIITGASAGSVGSIYHTPYIADVYEDARIVQIGDSFTGVFPEGFDGLETWGAHDNLPTDREPFAEINPEIELTTNANVIYTATAEAFPELVIGEFTSANDEIQTLFWGVQGGEDPADWQAAMFEKMDTLDETIDNFSYYIAGGGGHGVMTSPDFYRYVVNGTRYVDWFSDIVNGQAGANVDCRETDCESVELISEATEEPSAEGGEG